VLPVKHLLKNGDFLIIRPISRNEIKDRFFEKKPEKQREIEELKKIEKLRKIYKKTLAKNLRPVIIVIEHKVLFFNIFWFRRDS